MSTTLLKAGVIGLGVGERHISVYQSDPRCQVLTLCDIDEEKLYEVGRKFPDCRLTTCAEEILLDPEIDVVSIASYDTDHCEQVLLAIENGKHIFVEKPLCMHDEEFDQIDSALLQHPEVRLSSNLVLRCSPQFRQVKARIVSGTLGRLFYLEGDYNYGRIHKITEGWRGKVPFYSVSHGGAIHLIDLILWLSGGHVVDVMAVGNQLSTLGTQFKFPDMVTALLRFDDGMTAKVSANYACVCPHHHVLSVYGDRGSFVQTNQDGRFYQSRDPQDEVTQTNLKYDQESKGDVQRSFISQILDGALPEISVTDVMNVMAVSLAVERSLRSSDWESVHYARAVRASHPLSQVTV